MSFQAEDDAGDDDFTGVVGGAFVVAGGQVAELLEAVEAALDQVAALVFLPVERRRASAGGALRLAAGDLVGAFRAGESDPPGPHHRPGRGVRVGLVGQHRVRGAARPARHGGR